MFGPKFTPSARAMKVVDEHSSQPLDSRIVKIIGGYIVVLIMILSFNDEYLDIFLYKMRCKLYLQLESEQYSSI